MKLSFRRLLILAITFAAAFLVVTVVRTVKSGGSLWSVIPGLGAKEGGSGSSRFDLPGQAPLEIGDVELLSRLNEEYARLTEAVVPSVVSIDTVGFRSEQQFNVLGQRRIRDYSTQGLGSGVIVTEQGHIITNHHVIAGQQTIRVTLHGGKSYYAHLVGEDTLLDIAVLKIESDETFTPLKLGDSSEVKVGQIVFAVGNPFGLGETVTQGIISAKERSLSDNQRDLFQTDAAINPGNSGGPLVNIQGEIIGINALIYSQDKTKPAFQGVGFSIPSNDVKDALLQIRERGKPIRGYLGVGLIDLDPWTRDILGYRIGEGVVIRSVNPGSPAETAGLQPRDIILSASGEAILSTGQLLTLLQRAKVGSAIDLEIWRGGEEMKISATIEEAGSATVTPPPATDPSGQGQTREPAEVLNAIGIQVRDLLVAERAQGFAGVVVTGVTEAGLGKSKVVPGDLIITVNNSRIQDSRQFSLILGASAAVQDTSLDIFRNGKVVRVFIPALPRKEQ